MLQGKAKYRALARYTTSCSFVLITVLLLLASASQPAQSQNYKVIHNFTGKGSDGVQLGHVALHEFQTARAGGDEVAADVDADRGASAASNELGELAAVPAAEVEQ